MTWVILFVAGLFEIAWALGLKYTDGFTRPFPSAVVVGGYALSFWMLALVLEEMPIGIAYAVWAAVGTAMVAGIGIVAFGEPAGTLKLISLALIIGGVVGLNLAGSH